MKKQLRFLQSGMGCTERIQATYSALSGASKKIADFVIDHPDQAVHMTVVQLAESCEVSEASVVRFCQCLQYAGFYEFKLSLAAERHSAYFGGDANMNGTVSQKSFQAGKTAFCDFNSNSGIQFFKSGNDFGQHP